MMNQLFKLFFLLIALCMLSGCPSGAGNSEEDLRAAIEKDPETKMLKDGVEIEMLLSGDRLILGATDDFYSNFPDTLPLLPQAKPNNRLVLPEGPETFTFTTQEPWDRVQEFYLNPGHYSEKGWEILRQDQNDQAVNLEIQKGRQVVIISGARLRNITGADIGYAVREK